jgi:hypothetical protein
VGLEIVLRKPNKGKTEANAANPELRCERPPPSKALEDVPIAKNPGISIGNGTAEAVKLKWQRSHDVDIGWTTAEKD